MPIASISDFQEQVGSEGASGKDLPPYGPGGIYHEKQIGSMCAVHCVNNMLQGPLFDYSDFGQVAQELDRKERQLLGGAADLDYGNARADGFFNVQVIRVVLERAGYRMEMVTGDEVNSSKHDASKETAFILNKQEHWFALRRVGREWFDLNSCLKTPRHYTDGDVRFHIRDAVKQGYTVFAVRGEFPRCALEEDGKKLVEAVQGCGRPDQGYSLFAGAGQTLSGGGGGSSAPQGGAPAAAAGGGSDAAALRAARLARFGGGGGPAPAPPAAQAAPPAAAAAPTPTPSAAPAVSPALQQLMDMGFAQDQARGALDRANGNVEQAMEILLSS